MILTVDAVWKDYDNITGHLTADGWKVVRPQPRGIASSTGSIEGETLHDLASDVALCIRSLCDAPVVLLGQGFGKVLARVVTTDHPNLVRAAVLAAAEDSKVPEDMGKAPFIAGSSALPEAQRLALPTTAAP